MQRPGAAIGDEREIGGVEAALGGHPAHHMGHLGRGDAQDAVGRRGRDRDRAARRRASSSARSARLDVEPHLAAEEAVGAEPAEHEVGVGDGRLGAAAAVADRARLRARALRPDMQARRPSTRAIEPPPVPTSWMSIIGDLHRQAGGVAADQRAAGHQHLAVVDDAGLGGGAAHVEGDGVRRARCVSHSALVPITPAAGPGFQHPDAWLCASLDVEQAAGRLHDQERAGEAGGCEMVARSRRDSAARAARHRRWPPPSRCARTRDIPATARARP